MSVNFVTRVRVQLVPSTTLKGEAAVPVMVLPEDVSGRAVGPDLTPLEGLFELADSGETNVEGVAGVAF